MKNHPEIMKTKSPPDSKHGDIKDERRREAAIKHSSVTADPNQLASLHRDGTPPASSGNVPSIRSHYDNSKSSQSPESRQWCKRRVETCWMGRCAGTPPRGPTDGNLNSAVLAAQVFYDAPETGATSVRPFGSPFIRRERWTMCEALGNGDWGSFIFSCFGYV